MPRRNDTNSETAAARFAALLRSIGTAVIGVTSRGEINAWNVGAERLLGYQTEEIIGKDVSILIPPPLVDQEREIIKRLRHAGSIQDFETVRLHKDGRQIDVSLTYSAITDQANNVNGAIIVAASLAENRRMEKAEHDQLFLSAIVSSAEDAIVSKDLEGIVTSWNRSAERLFGYTQEEMLGQPISLLIPADHPNEEPQILARIRRGERIAHYETQRIRKDGRIIDVALTVSPIRDRMGRVIGASKIVRDIRERQRWHRAEAAESFLGALVESADDAIISKTLEGIVTSWNPAAERLYGYRAEEMIGKPIVLLIPSDHPDEEPQILQRIRHGESIERYETKRIRKDGTLIDVSLTVSPIKDELGRVIGASKIARDITEQKRAAIREREALRQAQVSRRQAEEANRTKDEFLATISHELRTPMTAIVGWSRLLLSGQLKPELQQRAYETIDRNARAQAQLIEDLLDVSRIVSGKLRVDLKPADLGTVVLAAVEAVRPSAEAKRIRIQTVISSDAGPILGDPERLQQVVWNLLSNAIRFTPVQGLVQVEVHRVESQVELQVKDNGIGISSDFLPHIFDRFTQADSSITRTHGGLGMGLSIVKSLVELHGGVVSASSPGEGQGATFTVKLPVTAIRHDAAYPSPHPRLSPEAALNYPELVGVKILVVDDEKDTCEMLRFLFNTVGAVVETANSAEMALKILDWWKPDILVSDIGMPRMDGYELISIIRNERKSRIPAVALTAMARIDDRIKALNAGYQMHVSKPVEPKELIGIVAELAALVDRNLSSKPAE
jgi:PAS domain S-box-containing protein